MGLIKNKKIIYLDENNIKNTNDQHIIIKYKPPLFNILKILTTKHSYDKTGKYFHFNSSDIQLHKGSTVYVKATCQRTNEDINLILWGFPNGGNCGDSHGRVFDREYKFEINKNIKINKILQTIKILSITHRYGNDYLGKYFHFTNTTQINY
jgi:hypothetical protein